MSVTCEQVLARAGAGAGDKEIAEEVLAAAELIFGKFAEDNLLDHETPLPDEIADESVLRVAVDMFMRAKTPGGQQILSDGNGAPVVVRAGSDPLAGVYQLVRPWVARLGLG